MIDSFTHIISKAKQNGKLILKNLGAKSLPKSNLSISFYDINYIDISGNKFTALPEVINEFQCLEALFCSHNNIRSLSTNINHLIYLETLDLSCNHLTSLTSSICKLECLKILLISSNRLVSLPKSVGSLKRLEELDASCNSLTCLPEDLSMLKQLKFLNLRHNKLLDVPINLSILSLEIFDLSENQLSSIPSEYHRIETLQSFNLSGNPLTFPPANVCNRGLLHIMKYLQSEFRRQNQRQQNRISSQITAQASKISNDNKYEPDNFEINPTESISSTPTTSCQSAIDFEQEFDSEFHDSVNGPYLPHVEYIRPSSFNRQDSGYNTITNSSKNEYIEKLQPKNQRTSVSTLSATSVTTTDIYPLQTSPSIQDAMARTTLKIVEKQFKKNKNYTSTSTPVSQVMSPQISRSNRILARNRLTKTRRNSLPNNDSRIESNNLTDHDSECVVVIDNGNSETALPSPDMLTTQSNNNNSFNKGSAYCSLRSMKSSRIPDSYPERKTSTRNCVTERIPEHNSVLNSEIRQKNQEAIKRFHKIIEAQLHVHINSKDLSQELSNGIYLCHLAKYLIPNCIPIVHTPSPGQRELGKQKCKRNLENFLETCRRNGVSEEHLFSARDVMNCNPASLLQMAKSVEALMQSLRNRKARVVSNCKPWRDLLTNPQSLSQRDNYFQTNPRSSSGHSIAKYRLNKSINLKNSHKSKCSENDIIQISSEV